MSLHNVEIETVAEVVAVEKETVTVCFYEDQRVINLMTRCSAWRDLQSISFPVDKTPEIIAAIKHIYDIEGAAR